jgi:hypothetical protein
VSEYADWPAEADAIAGNIDYDDELVDGGYVGYDDEGYGYDEWAPEIDPSDPLFQEAAREYALAELQDIIPELVEQQLGPLGREMEAALDEQRLAAGWDWAHQHLDGLGVPENDRQELVELVAANLGDAAQQAGVDVVRFLQLAEQAAGIGNGDGEAAAVAMLEIGAAALERHRSIANAKGDEYEVFDRYFRQEPLGASTGLGALITGRAPTQSSSAPPGDEFAVLRKYFPNG